MEKKEKTELYISILSKISGFFERTETEQEK